MGRCIGSGAAAQVREARDIDSQAVYAVKCMDIQGQGHAVARNEIEAFTAIGEHPNVVPLEDTLWSKNRAYIVMQLATPLRDHVSALNGGQMSERDASRLLADIAAGLQHCHKRGIAHCDLKPDNILVSKNGRGMLADFGLASSTQPKQSHAAGGAVHFFRSCGSPAYSAPCVLGGRCKDLMAADVWSFGVLAYWLLTGYAPFEGAGGSAADLQVQIEKGSFKDFPVGLSFAAKEFVCSLLQVDPRIRPQSASLLQHPFLSPAAEPAGVLVIGRPRYVAFCEQVPSTPAEVVPRICSKQHDAAMDHDLFMRPEFLVAAAPQNMLVVA